MAQTTRVDLAGLERTIEEELSFRSVALERKHVAEEMAKRSDELVADTESRVRALIVLYRDVGGDRRRAERWLQALYPHRYRFANMTLTDAITQILAEGEGPLHAKQILVELARGGAALWARNPLATVTSLLWRGHRQGRYTKLGKNLYQLTPTEAQQIALPLGGGNGGGDA